MYKRQGIKYSIDDNGLMTIVVDTSKDFGLSGSGKSTMIATSSGNQKINVNGEDIFVGINIYKKAGV